MDRHGTRWPATAGLGLGVPSWILLRIVSRNSTLHKILFCGLLFVAGTGVALVMPAVMAECSQLCPSYVLSYAVLNVGLGIGLQAGGFVSGALHRAGGWSLITLVLGLLSGLSMIVAVVTFRKTTMLVIAEVENGQGATEGGQGEK